MLIAAACCILHVLGKIFIEVETLAHVMTVNSQPWFVPMVGAEH